MLLVLLAASLPAGPAQGAGVSGYSEFFVPGDEEQLYAIFRDLPSSRPANTRRMHAVISVTAAADDTRIYYDHWEDGYDFQLGNPSTADETYLLDRGEVQVFESSTIPVNPRGTSTHYDGRDRLVVAGGAVTVTRASWIEGVGTVLALAWEIYPVRALQNSYTVPVGEGLAGAPTFYDDFDRVYVIAQSVADGNAVQIDDPSTPGVDVSVSLNRGEVSQLYYITRGTRVTSTRPVQVQFIVGDRKPTYEIRGFTAVPDSLWDDAYYNPVGGANSGNTELYIYNPQASPLTVDYEDLLGAGQFTVAPGGTLAYSDGAGRSVPVGSGVFLQGNQVFWAIGSGGSEWHDFDWGFSLLPAWALTEEYFLGWAPGTSEVVPSANGSPLYLTPVQDGTQVFVDFSPTDGVIDATYTVNRLTSLRIFDPDNVNTGMHIKASGPVAIAWGEDSDSSLAGNPYLDLGYIGLPFRSDWLDAVLGIEKSADPLVLPAQAGAVATFTLVVSTFEFAVNDIVVEDLLPPGWIYVADSTTISLPDGSQIIGPPANPSVAGLQLTWTLNQDMAPNEEITIEFQAETTASAQVGFNRDDARARGLRQDGEQVFSPEDSAFVNLIPLSIDKDTSTPQVQQGALASYTIRIANPSSIAVENVTAADQLPAGFTFAGGSVTATDAVRTAVIDPAVGDSALAWGTWTINPGGSLTISFEALVDPATPPGTYDNTATADSTLTGPIIDQGEVGDDPHAPPGSDPEEDEDVTVLESLPSITVDKSAAPAEIDEPGGLVTFTVQVENTSLEEITLTSLVDDLHGDLNGQGSCLLPQTLAIGASYTCAFQVTVSGNAGESETDTVTALAEDADGNQVSASDPATVTIRDVLPLIAVSKQADPPSLQEPGGTVSYTVRVDNLNPENLTLVVLEDDRSGDLDGQGTCALPQIIAGGGFYECLFEAQVSGNGGDLITNIVTAVGEDDDGNQVQDAAQATVEIIDLPSSLQVTKQAEPSTLAAPGGEVTFTVTIENNSPADTLTIEQIIDSVYGDLDGKGDCSVPQTLAPAGLYRCSFTETVTGGAGASITNVVSVSAVDDDGNNLSDEDQATVRIVGTLKTIIETNQAHTVLPQVALGEIITYEAKLTVPGGTYPDLSMTDVLDRGLAFLGCDQILASSPGLTTSRGSFALVCDTPSVSPEPSTSADPADAGRRVVFDFGLVSNPDGESAELTVRYKAVVINNAENLDGVSLDNQVEWAWQGGGLVTSGPDVTVIEPKLSIVKLASPDVARPGDLITFTLRFSHLAASRSEAYDLILTDQIPSGLAYIPGSLASIGGPVPTVLDDSGAPTLVIGWERFPNGGETAVIRFQARLGGIGPGESVTNSALLQWSSLLGDFRSPQSPHNELSVERSYDPLSSVDVYGEEVERRVIGSGFLIPVTGFAPGRITTLPAQERTVPYSLLQGMWLQIPSIGVRVPVSGVPLAGNSWDTRWLWNQAGFLEGTAFPTWPGNTAITAHVYLPNGLPGPFLKLGNLRWGDRITIQAYGEQHIYEVRQVRYVRPDDQSVFRHEEYDWLTLITCYGFDEGLDDYRWRLIVRAVLVEVK